jgi:hypothetical protein
VETLFFPLLLIAEEKFNSFRLVARMLGTMPLSRVRDEKMSRTLPGFQSTDWECRTSDSSLARLQEARASKTGFPSWELGNQPESSIHWSVIIADASKNWIPSPNRREILLEIGWRQLVSREDWKLKPACPMCAYRVKNDLGL